MTHALLGPYGIRTAMSAIAAGGGMARLPARLLNYLEWINAGIELTSSPPHSSDPRHGAVEGRDRRSSLSQLKALRRPQ